MYKRSLPIKNQDWKGLNHIPFTQRPVGLGLHNIQKKVERCIEKLSALNVLILNGLNDVWSGNWESLSTPA